MATLAPAAWGNVKNKPRKLQYKEVFAFAGYPVAQTEYCRLIVYWM